MKNTGLKEFTNIRFQGQPKGFTIFEIVMVLLLIGIMGFVVVGQLLNDNSTLVGKQAVLKAHIHYAQSLSMNSDTRTWGIRFDKANELYWLFYCDQGAVCNTGDNITYIPGADSDASNRIDLARYNIDLDHNGTNITLAFDTFGRPFWDGGLNVLQTPLTPSLVITLSDNSGNMPVTITPETGFIP